MSASLRLATPADIPALSALLSVLFAQEADFQPDPIVDPTLELEVGRRLLVPSLRVLTDVILSEQRRRVEA